MEDNRCRAHKTAWISLHFVCNSYLNLSQPFEHVEDVRQYHWRQRVVCQFDFQVPLQCCGHGCCPASKCLLHGLSASGFSNNCQSSRAGKGPWAPINRNYNIPTSHITSILHPYYIPYYILQHAISWHFLTWRSTGNAMGMSGEQPPCGLGPVQDLRGVAVGVRAPDVQWLIVTVCYITSNDNDNHDNKNDNVILLI